MYFHQEGNSMMKTARSVDMNQIGNYQQLKMLKKGKRNRDNDSGINDFKLMCY